MYSDYYAERAAAFADPDAYDPSNGAAEFGRAFGGRVNVCRRTQGCKLGYAHAGECQKPVRRTRKPVDPTAPTLESIRALLDTRDDAVQRAITLLYARQTAEEQASAVTVEHNGRGFNGADAELLTSFAQQIARGRNLTPRQMEFARRKVRKYARQILEVALAKHAAKAAKGDA